MTLPISRTQHSVDPQKPPTVHDVQTRLLKRGLSIGSAQADGDYGPATEAAVKVMQRKVGITSDGVVGPITWAHLNAKIPARSMSASEFATIALSLVTSPFRPHYRFGFEVTNLADPHPVAVDCSELVQWAIFQTIHKVWRDGSANQMRGCQRISVQEAIGTRGALLFISRTGYISGIHHVAISLGNGNTAEARSTAVGCGSWSARGRFNLAGLCPVLKY